MSEKKPLLTDVSAAVVYDPVLPHKVRQDMYEAIDRLESALREDNWRQ